MKDLKTTLFLILLAQLPLPLNANSGVDNSTRPANERPLTTYERFLPLAVAGDPTIQHFLGYMFFYGEGVELNYDEAHYWFHSAAEEGDARAQRNLGIFHARAIDRIPPKFYDAAEANLWFSLAAANLAHSDYSSAAAEAYHRFLPSTSVAYDRLLPSASSSRVEARDTPPGKILYQRFCAGCHGFNGYSAYPEAPSFALGDRLGQSDAALVNSIIEGKGKMPAWGGNLTAAEAREVLAYIRREIRLWSARAPKTAAAAGATDAGQIRLGEQIYLQFCGGCHGFNGIAWYVNSPSFALRERLHKSDAELANSIKNGRGAMPSWEYMLKPEHIGALIGFIRTLAPTYESGLIGELRRPDEFLRFRPKGEIGPNWTGDDQR